MRYIPNNVNALLTLIASLFFKSILHIFLIYHALPLWGSFAPSNHPGLELYSSYSWTSKTRGRDVCASNAQHYQMRMATMWVPGTSAVL